ncbi:MAG: pilus assembly protein TadG-related protein [Bryobacteraceae bacterium]
MKIPVRKQKNEAGQAVILVVVALSIFVLGAAGLAVDGSHLYAQRQMAQAAADAGAQAGILSIFDGTNSVVGNTHGFSTGATFTCATSDARTPCYYAQTMNRFNTAADTVTVDFPSAATVGVPTAPLASPATLIRVKVQRNVDTTLMRLLGPTVSTISASGTAAIVSTVSPVPIIITHPTNPSTFSGNGNITIQICGGPQRSIQVNSQHAATQNVSGNSNLVDLSHAGPNDPGDCSSGTGADFGDYGGPSPSLFTVSYGSKGTYIQPASPILDPLADVNPPPIPSTAPAKTALGIGVSGCPASPGKSCNLYSPGLYASGIGVKNETAVFKPGIYYVTSGGFGGSANGDMFMATGFTDTGASTTGTGWTGNMLVYNTGTGVFTVGSNGSATLVGSPSGSAYKGILLFQDRSAPAHITKNTDDHKIGGGGALSLTGTIYINNSLAVTTATRYQLVQMQGNGGSGTLIQGEIITNELLLGGSGTIRMNLNPAALTPVRQVALVN